MENQFYEKLNSSNARTENRNKLLDFILKNPGYLNSLVAFGTDLSNKNHYKAVWIIEMIAEKQAEMLLPYIDVICEKVSKYKNDSAIRGMSRVVFFIGTSKKITLTEIQEEKFIEISLDWLIRDERVACKVYAMQTLCYFGEKHNWINDELKLIINKDYLNQSTGYKVVARKVLAMIK